MAKRIAGTPLSAVLAIAVALLSKSFLDYSTSGMENPLTHFLRTLFLVISFSSDTPSPRSVFLASLTAALLMLNRMDCILLIAPALAWMLWRSFGIRPLLAAAGFLPLVAWEVFSLVYCGFPFPNTAYAKLNTGVWAVALLAEGINYLRESLDHDPITLTTVLASSLIALASRNPKAISVVIGTVLYLLYLLKVGGDFMGGRLSGISCWTSGIRCRQARAERSLPVAPAGRDRQVEARPLSAQDNWIHRQPAQR